MSFGLQAVVIILEQPGKNEPERRQEEQAAQEDVAVGRHQDGAIGVHRGLNSDIARSPSTRASAGAA